MRTRPGLSVLAVVIAMAMIGVMASAITVTIFARLAEAKVQKAIREVFTIELGVASWILRNPNSASFTGITSITALTDHGIVPRTIAEASANPWGGDYRLVGYRRAFAVTLTAVVHRFACDTLGVAFGARATITCPETWPGSIVLVFGELDPSDHMIHVAPVPDGGLVTGPGISCGVGGTGQCSAPASFGTEVTLTVSTAPLYEFQGWQGCDTATGQTCSLQAVGERTVSASFLSLGRRLSVSPVPFNGRITNTEISCGNGELACQADYLVDSVVTLTATAAPGYTFQSWQGCDAPSGATCQMTMSANKTVGATFVPLGQTLTVESPSNGSVTSSPVGIACPDNCVATFNTGTSVTLTATPGADYEFTAWGGACAGQANPCTITMDAAKTVSVTFAIRPATLVSVALSGSTDRVMTSYDGTGWSLRSLAEPWGDWRDVVYAPELGRFVAVSSNGSARAMISGDGINWTIVSTAPLLSWYSVAWSPQLSLFAAVSTSGSGQRAMTSPDGLTWTLRATPVDRNWQSVAWSPQLSLFVAVASPTSGQDRVVMTSSNGIDWTAVVTAVSVNQRGWRGVTWSPELGLFVAVADSGTGSRVTTSPNGTTWTLRTTPADYNWQSVAWSPTLGRFVAVAYAPTAATQLAMTSTDGATWALATTPSGKSWQKVAWSPTLNLFVAVGDAGAAMTSPDGLTWTLRAAAASRVWSSVTSR